jgi:hypothetical protein
MVMPSCHMMASWQGPQPSLLPAQHRHSQHLHDLITSLHGNYGVKFSNYHYLCYYLSLLVIAVWMVWLQSAGPMIATEDKDFKRSRKLSAFHTCKTRAKGPVVARRRNRWVLGICQRTETESLRTQECLNAPCVFRSSWLVKCWLYAHSLAVSQCIRQPRQNALADGKAVGI